MPTYDFRCKECNYEWDSIHMVADREKPTHDPCPKCGGENCVILIIKSAPRLCDPYRMGRMKPDDTWKDFTNELKRKNPGSDFTTW